MITCVGIIGCGKQASKHISGYLTNGIERIVVCDANSDVAHALAASEQAKIADFSRVVIEVAASSQALLDDDRVQAISICTPTPSHAPLIDAAIESGTHYLCEKPLVDDLALAERLATKTNAAGLTGMVGYIYRFAPPFEKLKEILDGTAQTGNSPALGKVTNAIIRIGGRGSAAAWKHQRATGGGAVNEMLVHMLDLAHWYFGPVQKIELLGAETRWPERLIDGETVTADAEDWVLLRLSFSSGVDVVIQADFITPSFTQYVEVQGSNGSFFGSIDASFNAFVHCMAGQGGYKSGKTALSFGKANFYGEQIGMFLRAASQGVAPDRCNLDDALMTMRSQEEVHRQLVGMTM